MFLTSMAQQTLPKPTLRQKLTILADAAKYDASCASSGTAKKNSLDVNANHTMEQIVEVARILRQSHDFRGYIHLKTIPEAELIPQLIAGAQAREAQEALFAADLAAVKARLAELAG